MKEKLRIGILLHEFDISSWESQIINRLINSDFAGIVLVIKDNTIDSSADRSKNRVANGLVRLIEKTDRLIFKTHADYKRKTDISGLLNNITRVDINSSPDTDNKPALNSSISEIKEHDPDIILSLGCHNLTGNLLTIPKFGVWSYSINNSPGGSSPATGFWEVIGNVPVTNTTLEILSSEKGKPEAVYSSFESTCRYSININRDTISWRSALFAPRLIYGLNKYGEDYLDAMIKRFSFINNLPDRSLPQISISKAAVSIPRYFTAVIKSVFKKALFTDAFRWRLLFEINGGSQLPSTNYKGFRKLSSPNGVFWADPFVQAGDDCYWIFVEEFIYKKDRAHISVLRLDKEGNFLESHKIIERPYHMSYPFIFTIGDTYYIIPETSKNKTIELYRCAEFPYKWEFDRNIMENISAVDSTLFHYNDKWWLFTAMDQTANISGCSVELFLFYTDDIFSGQWISHRLNPVVSDIRTARPAGKIFMSDGKIYRPSQNCAGRYGIGFNINLITKLTEYDYEETLVTEVKPLWDKRLKGTHTLNFDKDFTVIDAYSFRSRLSI
jgi:hypothetical protein